MNSIRTLLCLAPRTQFCLRYNNALESPQLLPWLWVRQGYRLGPLSKTNGPGLVAQRFSFGSPRGMPSSPGRRSRQNRTPLAALKPCRALISHNPIDFGNILPKKDEELKDRRNVQPKRSFAPRLVILKETFFLACLQVIHEGAARCLSVLTPHSIQDRLVKLLNAL